MNRKMTYEPGVGVVGPYGPLQSPPVPVTGKGMPVVRRSCACGLEIPLGELHDCEQSRLAAVEMQKAAAAQAAYKLKLQEENKCNDCNEAMPLVGGHQCKVLEQYWIGGSLQSAAQALRGAGYDVTRPMIVPESAPEATEDAPKPARGRRSK